MLQNIVCAETLLNLLWQASPIFLLSGFSLMFIKPLVQSAWFQLGPVGLGPVRSDLIRLGLVGFSWVRFGVVESGRVNSS